MKKLLICLPLLVLGCGNLPDPKLPALNAIKDFAEAAEKFAESAKDAVEAHNCSAAHALLDQAEELCTQAEKLQVDILRSCPACDVHQDVVKGARALVDALDLTVCSR